MPPRTCLFVPGDRPERFEKVLTSGADAVVLPLEDDQAKHLRATLPAAEVIALIEIAALQRAGT